MTTKSAFNEDKVALLLGCIIFILGLGKFAGLDLLGWVVKIGMWVDSPVDAWKPATKGMMAGWQSLLATYVFVTGLLAIGVKLMKGNVGRFVGSFTVIFFIAIACYTAGANAYIAANPTQLAKQGIPWALGLSTEAGLIAALVMGILISNVAPSVADSLRDACRPELFVKIAIVVLGAELGVKAADASGFAGHIIFRGLCAIVEAYLLYWAVVYYVARKYFKFNKEWAAPLASGISICGVSAAIATGGAIRARPVVPIMVSSLVVVFTCIEMLILPFIAQTFLYTEPMVAGGWMGLAVKSDGGAIASGAITESLFESELFGHKKGSFTDAHTDRAGKFEAAHEGTLFLDEIGNLPYHLQSKLLTAIQSRSVVRVGSNEPIPVNIRLICATNCNLEEMVAKGKFREDLLYRINTIHIEIPPLRERKEDIIPLAERFIDRFCKQYDKGNILLSTGAQEKLRTYPWYGNIRELEHAVEKAVIINEDGILSEEHFHFPRKIAAPATETSVSTLEEMELQMIQKAIEKCNGNLSAVAAQLGITRQTLYNKMKKFGL